MVINVVDAIMGAGKAQPLDSLVFTEDGYKKMIDIHIGDKVYGDDGLLHNVIGVFPQGVKEIYKVTFSDNTYTECCGEHLWTYYTHDDIKDDTYKTDTLNNIMNNTLCKVDKHNNKIYKYHIPIVKPLVFKKQDLDIDPYIYSNLINDNNLISNSYLYSDVVDRIELLGGLININDQIHNQYTYTTNSETLAKQIIFLAQSLSCLVDVINNTTLFELNIKLSNVVLTYFRNKYSSYKTISISSQSYNESLFRTIVNIESVGKKECQCILVDNPSHLYLTNDLIVTHNTQSSINFMNKSDEDTRFLYITPYLTEVKRIIESCPTRKFRQPESYGTKIKGIKYLFDQGYNIVSTHALFREFDEEIIDLAYTNNYTLIMDEVADVIETYNLTKPDLETILDKYATVDDSGLLKWHDDEYNGKFSDVKRLCALNCLAIYGGTAMMWLFPISTFKAFRNIYILTYMFDAQTQKYYYDYFGVEYNYLYVNHENGEYNFSEVPVKYKTLDYSKLIHICDSDKLNQIGDLEYALSKSWYERNAENKLLTKLKNATGNYFKNYTKTKSNENLWTTFKDFQSKISGKGYAKGYLASNTRATNEYRNRIAVAYLVNKFFNPYVKNFFLQHDIAVDEDAFAISEMLQFIWRSAIRDGKEIWLYIPSSRMRALLQDWISQMLDI